MSRVPAPPGVPKVVPGARADPLAWLFSGVGAESLRVGPPGGFVVTWRPAAVRGCGCRLRAARRATVDWLPDRHGPARVRPNRSPGPGQEDPENASSSVAW